MMKENREKADAKKALLREAVEQFASLSEKQQEQILLLVRELLGEAD